MPRKDLVSGCEVMTDAEFWQKMGEIEGRSAGEAMTNFYQEWDDAVKDYKQSISNPIALLKILKDFTDEDMKYEFETRNNHPEWYVDDPYVVPPYPVEVLEYSDLEYEERFRGSSLEFNFKALCKDGKVHTGKYLKWDDRGSFYNPPDGEEYIEWEEE